jgi:hypothetical protein
MPLLPKYRPQVLWQWLNGVPEAHLQKGNHCVMALLQHQDRQLNGSLGASTAMGRPRRGPFSDLDPNPHSNQAFRTALAMLNQATGSTRHGLTPVVDADKVVAIHHNDSDTMV